MQEMKEAALQEPKPLMQPTNKQDVCLQGETHTPSIVGQPYITNPNVVQGGKLASPNNEGNQTSLGAGHGLSKLDSVPSGQHGEEKQVPSKTTSPQSFNNDFTITSQVNGGSAPFQTSPCGTQSLNLQNQGVDQSQVESTNANSNSLLQYANQVDFSSYPMMCPSPSGSFRNPGSLSMFKKPDHQSSISSEVAYPMMHSAGQELWDPQHQDMSNLHYGCNVLKDLSDDNHNQSDIYSCLNNLDGSNSGSTVIDPSVSSTILDEFSALKNIDFPNPCDYLVGNLCPTQDVQSQITSASLADSQTFSIQEYADNSGGASSSNVDFDDNNLLQQGSFQHVAPRFRTYTKVR